MSKYQLKRKKAYCFQIVKSHIRQNLLWYISLVMVFVIGIVIGVLTALAVSEPCIDILIDTVLLRYMLDEISILVFLVLRIFYSAIALLIILLLSCKVWCLPGLWIFLAYKGYCIGFDILLLLISLGLSGVLCTIIIFIPCWILSIIVLCNCICVFSQRTILYRKYGKVYCGRYPIAKTILMYMVVLAIIHLIETLLVNILIIKFLIE